MTDRRIVRWRLTFTRVDGRKEDREQDGYWMAFTKAQAGAFGALTAELSKGFSYGKPPIKSAELIVENGDGETLWQIRVSLEHREARSAVADRA